MVDSLQLQVQVRVAPSGKAPVRWPLDARPSSMGVDNQILKAYAGSPGISSSPPVMRSISTETPLCTAACAQDSKKQLPTVAVMYGPARTCFSHIPKNVRHDFLRRPQVPRTPAQDEQHVQGVQEPGQLILPDPACTSQGQVWCTAPKSVRSQLEHWP